MSEYIPKFEDIGPHDPELVELLIKTFGEYNEDRLNETVDRINSIFNDEIEKAYMYDGLCD